MFIDAIVTSVLLPDQNTDPDDAVQAAVRIYEECRPRLFEVVTTAWTEEEVEERLGASFVRPLAERYWERYPDHKRQCDKYWHKLGLEDGAA